MMRVLRSGAVALLLAATAPSLPARAADAPAPAERPLISWTERLADINPVPGPITLRGDRGEFELFFNLSTRVDPVRATLHLDLSNSQALLANRSQLVIRLNDVVVAQLSLKPDAPLSRVDVVLPVELLHGGGNRLNFLAAQHYTNECEAPGSAELWSQINTTRSQLTVEGRLLDTAPLLSDLQELIGPGLFGGRDFTVMATSGPDGPTDDTLAVGASLSQGLALRLRYQPAVLTFAPLQPDGGTGPGLHLRAPAAASAPGRGPPDLLLFGLLDALRPVLGPDIAGAVTGGFVGIYALPSDPSRLVLLVTGRTPEELALAASAFSVTNFPFVDAPQQTVDAVELRPGDTFFTSNHLREGAKTSFAELGLKTQTLHGTAARTGLDVVLPPDLYVPDSSEAELSLDYSYGAGLRGDSVMNVLVNGVFQQAIPLADRGGAVLRDYRVNIPARKLLPGKNRIDFELIMVPLISGACVLPETRNLILSLADTSTISVAQGSHLAAQPDLHLFAATGFPYVGSDGFDLAFAARDPATVAAGWMLGARLAQVAGRVLPEGRVVVGSPSAGRHAILVGAAPNLPAPAAQAGPVTVSQPGALPYANSAPMPIVAPSTTQIAAGMLGLGSPRVGLPETPPASRVRGTGSLGRNGLLMASQAPGGGTFTLTTLTAASPETLRAAVQAMVRPQVWTALDDDVTLWRPAGGPPAEDRQPRVMTERVGPTYHLGSFRSFSALRYLVGEYPWVWLGMIAGAVLLLVAMLRLFILTRFRRVHPNSKEGIP